MVKLRGMEGQSKRIDLRARLWRLTTPIFFDLALLMLVGCVDTIMLSHCGDGSVAAVGMVNQLMSFVFLVYQFLATGASILCAQFFGAKAKEDFVRTAALAVAMNLAIGTLASTALFAFPRPLLALMGLRGDVMPHGVSYLAITGLFSIFPALSLALGGILRSAGRVVPPMAANALANIVNVTLNYALIFGRLGCPALGVEGAAWATAVARIVSFAVLAGFCAALVWRGKGVRSRLKLPKAGDLRRLVAVSIPAASEELSYCLSQLVAIYFINGISTDALTTKTYCSNLVMFVFLFCVAVTHGGDILVGHLVGRHRYRPAYLVGTFFMRRSMLVTVVGSSALAAAGHFVLPLLTANAEIVRIGTIILWVDAVLEIGRVRNIFACGTLRAAGDVTYPFVVGVAGQWIFGVGVAWLLGIPLGFGLVGVWVGFMLDENLRGVVLMRRWHSQRWRDKSFI